MENQTPPLGQGPAPVEKTTSFAYQARHYTWGHLGPGTKRIWFVAHGYGQLAAFFLRKFALLDPAQHYVIAPQGLSKHYLEGFTGRVGAVWMTREDRLNEIANYLRYLDGVWAAETGNVDLNGKEIYLFGFSQGTATICRWLVHAGLAAHKLILWAGEIPPDVLAQLSGSQIPHRGLCYVHGDQDELVTAAQVERHLQTIAGPGLVPEVVRYPGGHTVVAVVVAQL